MPAVEMVWRHLLVGTHDGQRRWPSVSALADELGMGVSTAHRSLAHPIEIGAVRVSTLRGLVVLDPARLLMVFAAHRHVGRDIVLRCRVDAPALEVEALAGGSCAVLGGFGAAVAHSGGVNRIADYTSVLFYGDPHLAGLASAPPGEGTEVLIATGDRLLASYGRVTPLCQAYADLFSLPGWQAARFVEALDMRRVAGSEQPVLLV